MCSIQYLACSMCSLVKYQFLITQQPYYLIWRLIAFSFYIILLLTNPGTHMQFWHSHVGTLFIWKIWKKSNTIWKGMENCENLWQWLENFELKNVGDLSKVFKNVQKDKFWIFSLKMILQYSCGITINTTWIVLYLMKVTKPLVLCSLFNMLLS